MKQTSRAYVVRLGALADLARPDVGVDVARLTRPVGEPANEGNCLVSAEVSAQLRVMALLQDALPQPPPVLNAQTIHFALPPAVEQATANEEGSACWAAGCDLDRTAAAVDRTTHHGGSPREDGPEERIHWSLPLPSRDEVGSQEVALLLGTPAHQRAG